MFAKVGQFERIAKQTSCRGRDDDLVGGSQSLQASSQIGRAAYRQFGLISRPGCFTNDDGTGGYTDPY
jgi:hypothetical protein